jgi:hypothetical protein
MDSRPTAVKKVPVTAMITISVGFHALVVWVVATFRPLPPLPPPEPERDAEAGATATAGDPDPEPMAIVLFDDTAQKLVVLADPVPTDPTMDRTHAVVATRGKSSAVTAPDTIIAPTPSPGEPGRQPHSMFQMRDKRVDVFASLQDIRNRERVPEGTKPVEQVPETGRLSPSGNGTHRSNEGVFTARVERDGSVNLKDARNLQIKFPDPRKIVKVPRMIGNGISEWYANDDKAPKDPEREPLNNKRPVEKDTRPDHGQTATVPILGGGFDITDAFMRRKKVDPYASRKLAYLDSTRDERVQIGNRYRKDQLAKSTELMQKQLDVVWASNATMQAKKQALFELWEDCAESGDAAVVEGGRAARMLVVGFISAKLPRSSADAFTGNELAALNGKRHAKAAFDPYQAGR